MTLRVYVHRIRTTDQRVAELLAAQLRGKTGKRQRCSGWAQAGYRTLIRWDARRRAAGLHTDQVQQPPSAVWSTALRGSQARACLNEPEHPLSGRPRSQCR